VRTPTEEDGGGKVKLIEAGTFGGVAAAIVVHPTSSHQCPKGYSGVAGPKLIISHKVRVEFRGKTAHAASEPWNGINALDAAVAAYNNIALW